MTDLERVELALRRALADPNPHRKAEVTLNDFLRHLYDLNMSKFSDTVKDVDHELGQLRDL